MGFFDDHLKDTDPEVWAAIEQEKARQNHNIELIASENNVSNAVLEADGCVMTNKYAEGEPSYLTVKKRDPNLLPIMTVISFFSS